MARLALSPVAAMAAPHPYLTWCYRCSCLWVIIILLRCMPVAIISVIISDLDHVQTHNRIRS